MAETRRCPQCGAEIPPDAAEGVCPKCLVRLGFEGQETSPVDPEQSTPVSLRFFAPEPKELSKRFPQLEILELLGQGGMGAVYKARQPALDRLVAVKILPPEAAEDPGFTERFTREARALAKLNHPNIVSIFDFGQVDGQFYFVMEFVDGLNLRQMLKASQLEPQEALAIVPQICDALQFAHDEGLVHRDIKPENILLDKKGRVKIADFGLAKLLGKTPADATLTGPGHVMGTLHYMSPEQLEHPLKVDHRADIYSLGVVFYEMLTAELPMGRFDPPSKKVQVDVRLDEVVLRALEREPQRRYQEASELKSGVESVVADSGARPAAVAEAGSNGSTAAKPPDDTFRPRLCKLPVWGALWAPFTAVLLLVVLLVGGGPGTEAPSETSVLMTILQGVGIAAVIIGVAAPIGSTALGFAGISRIRHSSGRLYGMGLAVFVALLYPLIIADGALLAIFYSIKNDTDFWDALLLVWVLVIVIVDALVVRAVWKTATR